MKSVKPRAPLSQLPLSLLCLLFLLLTNTVAQPSQPTEYWHESARTCYTVNTTSLDVPSNAKVFTTLSTRGTRNWQCTNGTIDPTQSLATGVATSTDDWVGTQTYRGSIAVWKLGRLTGPNDIEQWFIFEVDPTNSAPGHTVLQPQPDGSLAWGKWYIDNFTMSGNLDWNHSLPSYVTRINTTGGATPTNNDCIQPDTVVRVPYTAEFTLYYCPDILTEELVTNGTSTAPSEPTQYWADASAYCNNDNGVITATNTLDVPTNAVLFNTLFANGTRNFRCDDVNKISTQSNATGWAYSDDGWHAMQRYIGTIAVWDLEQKETGHTVSFYSDVTNTHPGHTVLVPQPDGRLAYARWWLDEWKNNYNGPDVSWVTRTDTEGGATPTGAECTIAGSVIEVPYTATFTFYYCPVPKCFQSIESSGSCGLSSASSARSVAATLLVIVAGVFFATLVL